MRPAWRLAVIGLAIAFGGCGSDPWAGLKPHQMLEKAERMFQQGEPDAGRALKAALDKAIKADIDFVNMRAYAMPLFQYHALRGELKEAEPLFPLINRPQEDVYVYPHVANNLAVLHFRAGRFENAQRVMAKAMHTFDSTSPISDGDRRSARMAMLANFDRMASATGATQVSAAAFAGAVALLQDLSRFQMGRLWPLEPGVKPFLERYEDFLRGRGRDADAQRIASLVAMIELGAPSPQGPAAGCIAQEGSAPVWCLLEAS